MHFSFKGKVALLCCIQKYLEIFILFFAGGVVEVFKFWTFLKSASAKAYMVHWSLKTPPVKKNSKILPLPYHSWQVNKYAHIYLEGSSHVTSFLFELPYIEF